MTSAASAIWGTRWGLTKLTASIRRAPAATERRISCTLSAVEMSVFSFCRPSRAETSITSILEGSMVVLVYKIKLRRTIDLG